MKHKLWNTKIHKFAKERTPESGCSINLRSMRVPIKKFVGKNPARLHHWRARHLAKNGQSEALCMCN